MSGRFWWATILASCDTEPVELGGGLLKIALGFWLLLPFDSFASSPSFVDLAVIPEPLLGAVILAFGCFHLYALRGGCPRLRRTASLAGFLIWFTLAGTVLLTNPPAMGWITFLAAACGQAWCYIRLRSEL